MPRFKTYNYDQSAMVVINYQDQPQPGTFEHAVHYLIEHKLDLSVFHPKYRNDATGRLAYDPAILLKIILFAYSKGITSSREMQWCCETNIIFKALSCDTVPHFTTLASFVSRHADEIEALFEQVLLVCHEQGLLGNGLFAIDGCKMSSDASKEWSGTFKELDEKREKLRGLIRHHLLEHYARDEAETEADLDRDIRRANMTTSKGTIQGYSGLATVDKKHLIIIDAQAFGEGQEHHTLKPVLEKVEASFKRFKKLSITDNIYQKGTVVTAESGFSTASLGYPEDKMTDLKNNAHYFDVSFAKLSSPDEHYSGIEFEDCQFSDCDFSASKFQKCKFTNCIFEHCNLSLVDFSNSKLFGLKFQDSKLVGVDWTKAIWAVYHSDFELGFKRCILNDSSFFGLTLNELVFEECKLHDVDFRGGGFLGSTMTYSDFRNSLFMRTNLQGVDFSESTAYTIDVLENNVKKAKFSRYEALNLLESLGIELVD